jgi:hypothetical protein
MQKNTTLLAIVFIFGACQYAQFGAATETVKESGSAAKRDIVHEGKKAKNRVDEITCMKDDVTCAANKAKHRLEEGGDAVKDTVKKSKDQID